jgi:3-hydroxyacyl-[acyl-carrier-protein] dehydratase
MRDEIGPQHPALAGHFPGNPIVPGVVILRRVCRVVTEVHGSAVTAVPVVKFHAPLKPAEPFDIALAPAREGSVGFRVTRGETLIAAGTIRVGAAASSENEREMESN